MLSRAILSTCALTALVVCPAVAGEPGKGGSVVIKAARVMPVVEGQPWVIERGVVVIRDGVIAAIGREGEVPLPPDLPVVEYRDETVMPGLVAASSDLAGSHAGDEAVAGAYRAVDAFDRYGDFRTTLAGGVTTVYVDPGRHRLITGVGAVVRLGGSPDSRVLREEGELAVNFVESAYGPPRDLEYIFPASSDVAIEPAKRQRPDSRLGQLPGLREALESSLNPAADAEFNYAITTLGQRLRASAPIRLRADRAMDLAQAVDFLRSRKGGLLVSAGEVNAVAGALAEAKLPLVYEVSLPTRRPSGNLGVNPEVFEQDIQALAAVPQVPLALSVGAGMGLVDLHLAAAAAQRAGLSEERIIKGVTRTAAEVLGVSDRVGSLAPGHDADLIVLTGSLLDSRTHVRRTYVRGEVAFEPPAGESLVVRAGTIWVSPARQIEDGEVLVENGKIQAAGHSVPRPPYARVIDAGRDAVVTPGWIDALGHLGLRGDAGGAPPDVKLSKAIGAADVTDRRVALSGVTTVALSPYRGGGATGAQVSAIKSDGATRDQRVVRDTAALWFDVRDLDPDAAREQLKGRLEAGKKYLETWQKYDKDLKEWEEKRKAGQATETKPAVTEQTSKTTEEDPLTGTWQGTVSGGPIPSPETGKLAVKLTGNQVEARVVEPPVPVEHKIVGTFDGKTITGRIEIDTQGNGFPEFDATIDKPDHMTGTIRFMGITVNLEGERIEKKAPEFKVTKSKTRGKDGRPLPPKVDEALEPLKMLLEKKIPAVVSASAHTQIDMVLKLFVEEYQLPLTLANAEEAFIHAGRLAEKQVGVILPPVVVRIQKYLPYVQGDDLTRHGVSVAFQSDAEDGARSLRDVGVFAVERGMSADAVLAAFTSDAAKLLKLEDRVGSLEPGRDGDLVIFNGPPLDAGTRVERVIINGREVE